MFATAIFSDFMNTSAPSESGELCPRTHRAQPRASFPSWSNSICPECEQLQKKKLLVDYPMSSALWPDGQCPMSFDGPPSWQNALLKKRICHCHFWIYRGYQWFKLPSDKVYVTLKAWSSMHDLHDNQNCLKLKGNLSSLSKGQTLNKW